LSPTAPTPLPPQYLPPHPLFLPSAGYGQVFFVLLIGVLALPFPMGIDIIARRLSGRMNIQKRRNKMITSQYNFGK
jgi:hypothetical protein